MGRTVSALDVPAERAFAFVQRETGFSRADLAGRSRRPGLVRSRALFAWALRHHRVSFPRIADALQRERRAAFALFKVAEDLRTVDPDFAARCAGYALDHAPQGPVIYARIVAFIADELGVDRAGLMDARGTKAATEARAMFVWAMRRFRKPQLSYDRIGSLIGIRHGDTARRLDLVSDELRRGNADFALSCERLIGALLETKEAIDERSSQ
jgi:hypothetical protein